MHVGGENVEMKDVFFQTLQIGSSLSQSVVHSWLNNTRAVGYKLNGKNVNAKEMLHASLEISSTALFEHEDS